MSNAHSSVPDTVGRRHIAGVLIKGNSRARNSGAFDYDHDGVLPSWRQKPSQGLRAGSPANAVSFAYRCYCITRSRSTPALQGYYNREKPPPLGLTPGARLSRWPQLLPAGMTQRHAGLYTLDPLLP